MDIKELRIMFMGTPDISAFVLERLILDGFNVVASVSQPDKPVGRKSILEPTPVKVVSEKYNVPCYQPLKIRKDYSFAEDIKPDIILTIAYGQIVPQALLDIPSICSLNIHGSLLPKYRGASPVQSALINCEPFTGVTLMKMIDKMDAGVMYAKTIIPITENDNCTSLLKKVAEEGLMLFENNIASIVSGKNLGVSQNENEATFCSIIKPEQEKIEINNPCSKICGLIQALSDYPGAYLMLDGEKYKIFKAVKCETKNDGTKPGTIIQADKNGLVIATIDGGISVLDIQKEGKKRMNYKDFLNGNHDMLGKVFE